MTRVKRVSMYIVLFEPEIPQNSGNIIRLCVNAGAKLIVIEPCGFALTDKNLKRAGLDYHDKACLSICADWADFVALYKPQSIYAFSTKATVTYSTVSYQVDDFLLFGPESRGLPLSVLQDPKVKPVRVPMQSSSRSINLANTVAIGLFEAMRQLDFPGCE